MKKIMPIIFLLLSLISCNKDEECKMEEKLDLYQTYWEGTLFYRSSGVENKLDIKVTFESTIVGEYAIEDMNSNIPYSSKSIFQYEVKDKIINISDGYKNILVGKWWIIRHEDGNLILQKNISDKNNGCELCLTKKI